MLSLICLLIVAALTASLSLFVWRARPTQPANRWFAFFALSSAGWSIGLAGLSLGSYPEASLKITFASASLLTTAFFAFCHFYPQPGKHVSSLVFNVVLAAGFLFAALSVLTPFIAYDASPIHQGFHRRAGALHLPFAVFIIGGLGSAILLLLHKFIRATGLARIQLQYVIAGVVVSVVGCVTTNLLVPLVTGRSTYSLLGPILLMPFVLLVAHAIIRHRLMDLRLAIHRSLISLIASLVSTIPILMFLTFFWHPVFGTHDSDYLALLLIFLVAAALLIPPIRTFTSTLLNRYAYRTHANFQLTVRRASRRFTQLLDLRTLLSFVSQTISDSMQAEGVATYLVRGVRATCAIATPETKGLSFRAPESVDTVLLEELAIRKELILHDETAPTPSPRSKQVQAQLAAHNWALILPLLSEDVVIGAIMVGPKRSGDPFYPQDIDLLMTLAHQAGTAIKNSQLYTQVVLANEYIENIVATIESGVVAVDAEGYVTIFNPAAEQLTGVSQASAKESRIDDLPTDLAELITATLLDGQQRTKPEMPLSSSATTRPVICTTSALRGPVENILGAVAVFSDLTPLKELESERRRAERLAYFEILASSLAHEIKNPLVAIKAFAQLIPRRHRDEQFVDEFSRVVTREIGRMERLVERLRCLSRPSDRPQQATDIRDPLGQALASMRPAFEEKRIILNATFGADLRAVIADPPELEQLFNNLLMNAYEATSPGGTVTVELKATAEAIVVEIADSGSGIPPEILEHIFDPFVTSKPHGSGLGLTISAGIAAAHTAKLRGTNRPEGGAVFAVEFSFSKPPTIGRERSQIASTSDLRDLEGHPDIGPDSRVP